MSETEDIKKYKPMESVLIEINRKYISLPDEEIRRNNAILWELLALITGKMIEKNSLFREMYSRVFYGGSYYDGLRVGKPDEFDLDLLLSLPKLVEPTITTSNIPGYIQLELKEMAKLRKQAALAERYKGLDKLINEKNYLDTSKVLSWMEGVVQQALNCFQQINGHTILKTNEGIFFAKIHKAGPAFTLKVNGTVGGNNVILDVDLVPCFVFGKEKWPANGFRANPIRHKPDFFIVPKPLTGVPHSNLYWRLSFQEQERCIIDSKKTLKPTVKLLKKMRDTQKHGFIASYYLKTLIMWQTEKRGDDFWNKPLSYVFMIVLKEYQTSLSEGKIPYYWYKKNNLLGKLTGATIVNVNNKIKAIIDDVDKHPLVIAKYLLNPQELYDFNFRIPVILQGVSENEQDVILQGSSEKEQDSNRCIIL